MKYGASVCSTSATSYFINSKFLFLTEDNETITHLKTEFGPLENS